MKRTIFTLLLAGFVMAGAFAQTLLYENDFEDGLAGATIVGTGAIVDSGDPAHGMVFHNSAGGQAVRSNYMLLPATIMTDLAAAESNALTISFWVNKSTATGFYWSPMFSAYGAAPNPNNTWPMMVLQTRGVVQVNANGTWSDFVDNQNLAGTNTVSTAWIDAGDWKFYTAVLTPTNVKVYIDGAIMNEWQLNGDVAGGSIAGLFSAGTQMPYICLGGNQAWNWNDPDPAFMYNKLKIYSGALSTAQINSLMINNQLSAPVLTVNTSAVYLDEFYSSQNIIINGSNLSEDISIVAPAGINVSVTSIPQNNASDVSVSVSFDGVNSASGVITINSGSLSRTVNVRANTTNFVPAYASGNMIADPTFSAASLSAGGFGGWGPTGITNEKAYSGRGSAYIRGTCWPDGGSIDRALTAANGNQLKPNTTYRLRAMLNIKASPGTNFQFEIEGYDGTTNLYIPLYATDGWVQFDNTFTTGATVTVDKGIYFNSCSGASPLITDSAFIDNYELYEVPIGTSTHEMIVSSPKVYMHNNAVISTFTLSNQSEVSLAVYDLQGKAVMQSSRVLDAGNQTLSIDNNLQHGIYIVKLHSYEFTITSKLIVQ